MEITELPNESWYAYMENIPKKLRMNDNLFKEIWNLHPEERDVVKLYGKTMKTPRWFQSYGKSYNFSNVNHKHLPIENSYLKKLLKWVNKHSRENFDIENDYTQILINWYQDGQHYISAHSDDESALVQNSPIYSFSFGQERDFRITSKTKEIDPITISLPSNSLIVMGGKMQKFYKHEIPKRSVSKCPEKRINITFRLFK